jgi:hypothetical protein
MPSRRVWVSVLACCLHLLACLQDLTVLDLLSSDPALPATRPLLRPVYNLCRFPDTSKPTQSYSTRAKLSHAMCQRSTSQPHRLGAIFHCGFDITDIRNFMSFKLLDMINVSHQTATRANEIHLYCSPSPTEPRNLQSSPGVVADLETL